MTSLAVSAALVGAASRRDSISGSTIVRTDCDEVAAVVPDAQVKRWRSGRSPLTRGLLRRPL